MMPLVFMHGYLGGSPQWAGQLAEFGARFAVVTPDLPGFGLNNRLPAPETIGGFADYLLEQLARQGVDRFHLVGHSMGGMIVQEMAARAPRRIARLVLYGTGPVGVMPGRFETIDESRRRLGEDGVEATGRRIAANWFVDGAAAEGYPACAELTALATPQAALAGLAAMEHWSGLELLAKIAAPTLVLWGDRDRSYQWPQPERLWREIAGASLGVLPGCCHAAHLEKPQLFNAMLLDFLAGADDGPAG